MHVRKHVANTLSALLICVGAEVAAGNEKSGLQATPTGVPWYVASRPSKFPGAEAAMRIASSKWRAPWAMKIKSEKASGQFRLVTVNGATYVVLAKMKGPFSLSAGVQKDAKVDLLRAAADKAGCKAQSGILAKYSQFNEIEKLATEVQCSYN